MNQVATDSKPKIYVITFFHRSVPEFLSTVYQYHLKRNYFIQLLHLKCLNVLSVDIDTEISSYTLSAIPVRDKDVHCYARLIVCLLFLLFFGFIVSFTN